MATNTTSAADPVNAAATFSGLRVDHVSAGRCDSDVVGPIHGPILITYPGPDKAHRHKNMQRIYEWLGLVRAPSPRGCELIESAAHL